MFKISREIDTGGVLTVEMLYAALGVLDPKAEVVINIPQEHTSYRITELREFDGLLTITGDLP